jgi:hypothetical protein
MAFDSCQEIRAAVWIALGSDHGNYIAQRSGGHIFGLARDGLVAGPSFS